MILKNINLVFEEGDKQLADSSGQTLAQSRTMIQIVLGLAGVCLVLSLFLGVWTPLWTDRDLRRLAGHLGQGAEMVAKASNHASVASQQLAQGPPRWKRRQLP
ncbi:hypothetical protein [Dethiosulfatarculus sandiegensis]|uniref:Uncharacterized protein n=1 Tax=Dethiosulfatarculus sandiegensis TaxID=1429043 RepID=A0A0D2JWK2_9BACT|nr:hypothetical protein [Dethiosulfatarculus sandiegensis]KIX13950.1 hypothetical protein X474_12505 [Dethiosulfatarculus sandiegensis]